mgnify:FL=1
MRIYGGSWCAAQDNVGQYLQADFGHVTVVTRMVTQGHHLANEWVVKTSLNYSTDGGVYFKYSITGGETEHDPVTVSKLKYYF